MAFDGITVSAEQYTEKSDSCRMAAERRIL